jgi:cation diffusion facilitator family transporter
MDLVRAAVPRIQAVQEKGRVARTSLAAAFFLTGIKLVTGLLTGSLGVLSEAAHSGLDLVAAWVTVLAVRASARPADGDHSYGHGKVENLSALFEAALLIGTCAWIVFEAVERLVAREVLVQAPPWAMAVIVISIAVDWSRSRALARTARRYQSRALEADALHFSSDIWSSAVVLVGLLLVRVAHATGQSWLLRADTIAALGVAGLVARMSVALARRSVQELLDGIPPEVRTRAAREAARLPGVREVRRVRIRRSGAEIFGDLLLVVERGATVEQAHRIATRAAAAVRRIVPGADLVVHLIPAPAPVERVGRVLDRIRREMGGAFRVQRLEARETEAGVAVSFHCVVLGDADHAPARETLHEIERRLLARIPDLAQVSIHAEADPGPAPIHADEGPGQAPVHADPR